MYDNNQGRIGLLMFIGQWTACGWESYNNSNIDQMTIDWILVSQMERVFCVRS